VVITQHLAGALKSTCHSRPTCQKQSGTGMRPSLLAGPQAGRDFAKGPEWRLACAADISEQTAQCQYVVLAGHVRHVQTVVFLRPRSWGPGRFQLAVIPPGEDFPRSGQKERMRPATRGGREATAAHRSSSRSMSTYRVVTATKTVYVHNVDPTLGAEVRGEVSDALLPSSGSKRR